MQNGGASETGTASKDLRFDCPHCSAPMVVCSTATVKLLDCPRCKKSVRIPRSVLTAMGQPVAPDASTPIPKPAMIAAASARKAPLTTSPLVTTSASQKSQTTNSISAPSSITKSKETEISGSPNNAALEELKRRLKENESQRTEVTGHINQLNIQLHRWQLRLNMLNERHKEFEAELGKSNKA